MYEKLIDEWAQDQGFQGFQVDHAAVLRNLAKWFDWRASIEQQVQLDSEQKQGTFDNPVDAAAPVAPRELT